ncbi:MAG TPA: patatin-like phospholipase family protein [Candidatus Saccharimonadia bacterium]|nr:patatin-like phospholipase family protein [Candidatus Saccharimonadia bacterium]
MRASPPILRFPWFSFDGLLKRFHDPAPAASSAPPRIGLVLSCGGARGLAHIGVIQVLEEAKIPISAIMGSSMGAYVGTLWAAGVPGDELAKLAAEIRDRRTLVGLVDLALPPLKGFLRGHKLRKHLERTLGEKTLADLPMPMHVVATNLDTVCGEVLPPSTPAAAAVQASCAIPGIVSPVSLNDSRWIDGGAAEPLPVELLHKVADLDYIIAVNVMPTLEDIASSKLQSYPMPPPIPASIMSRLWAAISRNLNLFAYGNVLDTFKRCLTSSQLRVIAHEGARADVLIHPFFHESRWYDFENFNRYIESGRTAALEALPQIQKLLKIPRAESSEQSTPPRATPVPNDHQKTANTITAAAVCGQPDL